MVVVGLRRRTLRVVERGRLGLFVVVVALARSLLPGLLDPLWLWSPTPPHDEVVGRRTRRESETTEL